MTDSKPHATRADIEAILKARQQASVQNIPALPQKQASPTPATPTAKVTAQSTPVAPAQPPLTAQAVSDTDLTSFLTRHLPGIQAAAVALATPPFAWTEVLELGQVVSQAVKDGLPMAKGTEAAQLVQVITAYAYDHYLVPALPSNIRPFAPLLRPLVLQAIEAAYQLAVKRRLSK